MRKVASIQHVANWHKRLRRKMSCLPVRHALRECGHVARRCMSTPASLIGVERMSADGNLENGVKRSFSEKTLRKICQSPVSALEGINIREGHFWNLYDVITVQDLALWKPAEIATHIMTFDRLISSSSKVKIFRGRKRFNFRNALNEEYKNMPIYDLVMSPPMVIRGISSDKSMDLARVGILQVQKLANYRPYIVARAITCLAEYEEEEKE
ncbi:hypothetical protein FVE85_9758 [Porphyridium purpureum]|uniref:Uncharacterized protein n=1 Tax=Porphyridium purpureum TaxID=35688 RepID=A0A5J4YJT2_PORPP|nr:hypothetical protein FVE85_9758 [Porphyridium purpureum]|eukprot:POR1312..scf246_12